MYHINVVCFRYVNVNTVHKGDNNNNNNNTGLKICTIFVFLLYTTCISLFNSLSIMRDSKQILNILFLCLLSARFRANADRRISTKFPTCVIDNFCVWLKWTQSGSLLGASNYGEVTVSLAMSVCPSVHTEQLDSHWTECHDSRYLNIIPTAVREIQVQRNCDTKRGSLT